jgi:protein-S-isoprenylcysteine O-methyltransferase Ste14
MMQKLIILSFLFLLSEIILMLVKRSRRNIEKKNMDRGSLIIMWVTITISLTIGFRFANYGTWNSSNYYVASIGLLFYSLGLIIRWTTIFQLKKAFTVDVAINENHELKTDGLYRIVRHPSYLGLIMIIMGLSVGMNTLFSFLVITIPVFLAIAYRIHVEEAVLMVAFGEKYKVYMKVTRKIIPYIY